MSEENVEMFKRALDAGNRRDPGGLTRDFHAEARMRGAALVPTAASYLSRSSTALDT
jgi:hypothetical protein